MSTRYVVRFGSSVVTFAARYHAEQLCRALLLNGTPYTYTEAA